MVSWWLRRGWRGSKASRLKAGVVGSGFVEPCAVAEDQHRWLVVVAQDSAALFGVLAATLATLGLDDTLPGDTLLGDVATTAHLDLRRGRRTLGLG